MNLFGRARAALACAAIALVGAIAPAQGAEAGGCHFIGTATFEPPLSLNDGSGTTRLSAELVDCAGSVETPATGTVSAGNVWAEPSPTAGETWEWQEPAGSLSGTCLHNTTTATSIVRWDDGTITVVEFNTSSGTYGVAVSGGVVASAELAAVNQKAGQPDTKTVTTDRLAGGTLSGLLAATPPDAGTSCGGGGLGGSPLEGVVSVATAP